MSPVFRIAFSERPLHHFVLNGRLLPLLSRWSGPKYHRCKRSRRRRRRRANLAARKLSFRLALHDLPISKPHTMRLNREHSQLKLLATSLILTLLALISQSTTKWRHVRTSYPRFQDPQPSQRDFPSSPEQHGSLFNQPQQPQPTPTTNSSTRHSR